MKRVRWILSIVVALAVVFALVGLPIYVFPPVTAARPSDAILVLGPPTERRVDVAEHLREAGIAKEIVVSTQEAGGQEASNLDICREHGVTCEIPEPFTTRGEMLLMAQRADASGPPSITVVTFTPHVTRTRYIFGKCYGGQVDVVAVDQPLSPADWAYQYVYQSVAFVKALVEPCP